MPFSQARIARSIDAAAKASGRGDGVLAEELAGVVTLFLEKRFDDAHPPLPGDIRDMVRRVLVETGHGEVARSYAEARSASTPAAEPRHIDVWHRRDRFSSVWDRARLVNSLIETWRLDESDAGELAAAVESRLAALGLQLVTSNLVRELVDLELASREWCEPLDNDRSYEVPRSDVESWLFADATAGVDPEAACAAAVLGQWAARDLYPDSVMKAHASGLLHVVGLGTPQRVESVAVDTTGPVFAAVGHLDELLLAVLPLLEAVAPLTRDHVFLRRFSDRVATVGRPASRRGVREFVERLVDHLLKVDVFGRPLLPKLTLEVHLTGRHLGAAGDAAHDVVAWLAESLMDAMSQRRKLEGRLGLVFVFDVLDDHPPESRLLDRVLHAARSQSDIGIEILRDLEAARSGSRAGARDRVVLDVGATVINLPLALAGQAGAPPGDLQARLEPVLADAVLALREKYWFLRRSASQTLRGVMEFLPGGEALHLDAMEQGGRILLWGLPYAVAMSAPGNDRGERAEALAKILSCIDFLLGDTAESPGLAITVGGVQEREVRERMLRATMRQALESHDVGLGRALAAAAEPRGLLPLESPILDAVNRPVLGGRFLRRLRSGLPLPTRGDDHVVGGTWLRRVIEGSDLRYFELEGRIDVFEDQGGLFPEAGSELG